MMLGDALLVLKSFFACLVVPQWSLLGLLMLAAFHKMPVAHFTEVGT